MRIDVYTKTVLTIIAACLMWLSLGGAALLTPVNAQDTAGRVYLAGWVDSKGYIKPFPFSGNENPAPLPIIEQK